MANLRHLLTIAALALLSTIVANAQSSSNSIKHFEKDLTAFDYPGDWKLTDNSTDDVEYLIITSQTSGAQIAVIVQPDPGASCMSEARSHDVTNALVDRVAVQIHAPVPIQSSLIPTSIGSTKLLAVELHGVMNNKRVTAHISSLMQHRFFINMVWLKFENDDSGTNAWEIFRTTFKIAKPVPVPGGSGPPGSGGVLNGKAIRLPQPEYPLAARRQRASGTVVVQVEIDETGTVTLACAISGDPTLQEVSVAAAKQAKFTSTKLSGKPVKVIGVIVYNFVHN